MDREFGYREVAEALERFTEIYGKSWRSKTEANAGVREIENIVCHGFRTQRMKLFMETQFHLQKLSHSNSKDLSGTD